MKKKFTLTFMAFSVLLAVLCIAFCRSGKSELTFEIMVKQQDELETHVIRDCLSGENARRTLDCFRELYPHSSLKDEEVASAVVGGRVISNDGVAIKMSFKVRASTPKDAKAVACGYRRAIEALIAEKNLRLYDRYLAQLQNRAEKLKRKLMKRRGDVELENALSNAVAQVLVAEEIVAEKRIEIIEQ